MWFVLLLLSFGGTLARAGDSSRVPPLCVRASPSLPVPSPGFREDVWLSSSPASLGKLAGLESGSAKPCSALVSCPVGSLPGPSVYLCQTAGWSESQLRIRVCSHTIRKLDFLAFGQLNEGLCGWKSCLARVCCSNLALC